MNCISDAESLSLAFKSWIASLLISLLFMLFCSFKTSLEGTDNGAAPNNYHRALNDKETDFNVTHFHSKQFFTEYYFPSFPESLSESRRDSSSRR